MAVLPFRSLVPPLDGTTDALPWFQQAIAAMARMGGLSALDLGGHTYSVSQPVENTVAGSLVANGTIKATGTFAAWSGGSMDSRGIPMQKGVIRCRADGQTYRDVTVIGGPPGAETEVVAANWRYTERRRLANGFEDAPVGAGNYAKALRFINCRADDTDLYGFRYASQTGGGFNLTGGGAREGKNFSATDGSGEMPADHFQGAGVLLDANDGYVDDFTPWGGEFPIHQIAGGTIRIWGNHPVMSPAVYKRSYFGAAGVPILTGIQVRTAGQIGAYDNTKVTVTRRAADWQVIVTPIADIAQADAVLVRIRRDEVAIYMNGWGSDIQGNYLDGGPIRVGGEGHTVGRQYGLPAAMTDAIGADLAGGTAIATVEFKPRNSSEKPPRNVASAINFGEKRMALYPRLNQSSFTANNLLYEAAVLEGAGQYAPLALRFGSTGDFGHVASFHGNGNFAGIALHHAGAADVDAAKLYSGHRTPEAWFPAAPGSIVANRTNGSIYAKRDGTMTAGWEMVGTRCYALTADANAIQDTDAQETVLVDTAVLTQNRDLRITPRITGVPGGIIRVYSARGDAFLRNVRINTAAAFTTIAAGRFVEIWWNGTTWTLLRNVVLT